MTDQAAPYPGWRRYEPVWSARPVRRAFAGTLLARTAQTMLPLTILLLFRERTGSFAAAGVAVAVSGLASVAGGPITARLADRRGTRVLAIAGVVSAASLVLLAMTPSPALSWIAVTAAGLSTPPLTAALRATITTGLTAERDRAAAFSMDAIATELLFIAGIRRSRASHARLLVPWLAIGAAQMAAIGFVEVAATARVIHFGDTAAAGTVLAVWAAGSMAGGLVYGGRDWPGKATTRLRVLLLLLAAGFAIVSAAGTMAVLYPLMFAAGLACAPAAAALTTSFSAYANRTESFAWLASASSLGGSSGYAAAGLLVAHDPVTTAFLVGAALLAVAAAVVPRTPGPDGAERQRPAH